jgi:hypothetical protein
MLMMALARKELMERQHRKLLRGLLATVVHLCELPEAVEAFLQAGALTTVLFFTLVLTKESVTAPETDLAILTLRFLSANNKKAQRIIRHMGGAELAICVQEGSLYSASVPDAPLETRYKLQLDEGKITKQFVPPHLRIKAAAALQLTPPTDEVRSCLSSNHGLPLFLFFLSLFSSNSPCLHTHTHITQTQAHTRTAPHRECAFLHPHGHREQRVL